MFAIKEKKKLAKNTFLMRINAPDVAKKAKPGQFIILRIDEYAERVPLTIADSDTETITIVVLAVGKSTERLVSMDEGQSISDFVGPLGTPSEIQKFGTVCLVGGGLGIAPIHPIAKAMKEAGNKVISIIGAKSKEFLFWEEKLKAVSDEVVVCTDDGSYARKGFVTEPLMELVDSGSVDRVIVIGPPIMMKVVSGLTKGKARTIASLNPLMVDGMGMCGGCRVTVGGVVKFACCDGPEFDAHLVDWDELMNRNRSYVEEEIACRGESCANKNHQR